jgi:hypothetical protein
MNTEFTFPLALCNAQWAIWLHTLEMLESWRKAANQAAMAFAFCPATIDTEACARKMPMADLVPRRAAVANALLALNTALAASPAGK